jgi:dihydrofolate reductase
MAETTPTRKLVYYIAMTVHHYIAREDESVVGFLAEGHHIPDYLESLQAYDTVLMGRRTYEWGYQWRAIPSEPSPTYGHMISMSSRRAWSRTITRSLR